MPAVLLQMNRARRAEPLGHDDLDQAVCAAAFVVGEVWETQEQHDTWFNENVKPNVPFQITQQVINLHSVHKP